VRVWAEVGTDVLSVDVDVTKVDRLKRGTVPIYEPGLDDLVRRSLAVGHLSFAASTEGHPTWIVSIDCRWEGAR
jgi:UDPglucose 6-dehydrogenase